MWWVFLSMIILTFIDQYSKNQMINYLNRKNKVVINKGIWSITIVKNPGAFLGILRNRRKLLVILQILFLIIIFMLYVLILLNYPSTILLKLSFILVISGGCGNLIDRLKRGYVIDFLTLKIKKFPVFNLADVFIFTGAAMLLCYSFTYLKY